jgi:hypothetical protein
MKWKTVDALLESAKKYAAIEEDLAVKSYKDHVYWHHKVIVDLIRTMSSLIEEYEERERNSHGEAVDFEGHKETGGASQESWSSGGKENTS